MTSQTIQDPLLNTVLPSDSLKVKKVLSDGSSAWAGFFVILIAFGFLVFSYFVGQSIYDDYKWKGSYTEINANIDGECSSRLVFFTDCKAKISYNGQKYEKDFAFLDIGTKDYEVIALQSRLNPSKITLDLAIEKIPSRIFVVSIFVALGVGLIWFGCVALFRNSPRMNKVIRALNNNGGMQLALYQYDAAEWEKKKCIRYNLDIDGTQEELRYAIVKKKEAISPLFITKSDDDYVLVVKDLNSGYFTIVDHALNRFVMNKKDRKEFRSRID
ncbi:MAG: hypothetical protein ACRCXK_10250, partial [Wohlfahrtiimonas sp.]